MSASLTGWDFFVGLVFLFSIWLGVWRGLVRTVFALAGWIAAFVVAPLAAPVFVAMFGMQAYPWVAYLLLFVGVLVGVRVVGGLLARGLRKVGLGGADRALGALLGAARALLIVGVVAIAAKVAGLADTPAWKLALCRPLLDGIVARVQPHLPGSISGLQRT